MSLVDEGRDFQSLAEEGNLAAEADARINSCAEVPSPRDGHIIISVKRIVHELQGVPEVLEFFMLVASVSAGDVQCALQQPQNFRHGTL